MLEKDAEKAVDPEQQKPFEPGDEVYLRKALVTKVRRVPVGVIVTVVSVQSGLFTDTPPVYEVRCHLIGRTVFLTADYLR